MATIGRVLELVPGRTGTIEDLVRAVDVAPRHEWLLHRWLLALSEDGAVDLHGGDFHVVADLPRGHDDLDLLCTELRLGPGALPFLRAAFGLLPELLRDDLLIHHLLPAEALGHFPDRVNVFVEQLTDVCAMLVGGVARERQDLVRVLEIGGDSGHATAAMLDELSGLDFTYVFTDSSAAAVGAAARRFDVPARVLDAGRSLMDQCVPPSSADVVIAVDVLHLAPALGSVLREIFDVLVTGGQLLLVVRTGDGVPGLLSSHFSCSPPRGGGEVHRGGEVFPDQLVWRDELRAAGFTTGTAVAAADLSCPTAGYCLFQAVKSPQGRER